MPILSCATQTNARRTNSVCAEVRQDVPVEVELFWALVAMIEVVAELGLASNPTPLKF
jgi:hypothetical protein